MLEQLNEKQREAVLHKGNSHALILAGAGSGKTKVLTTRIAWLIKTGQANPFEILAVTFTNKAAREMLQRVSCSFNLKMYQLWIGTFHGLCNRFLRKHYKEADLPRAFQILDSSDQLATIKRLLKINEISEETYPPREIQRFINNNKEAGSRAQHVVTHGKNIHALTEIYQLYEVQCYKEGIVDLPELLLRTYELFLNKSEMRGFYQNRFRHILVDEFQDTNILQYRWLQLLTGKDSSVFAVGDDDQSIYSFRGASSSNMLNFERDYAKGRVIRLEQNYRSLGNIIQAANNLIEHNRNRLGKKLWTDKGEGEPLIVLDKNSEFEEAQWIVNKIKFLNKNGFNAAKIGILYRSNAQSRVLEQVLFANSIPYMVYGGLRFFERQEIKHALAYLRLINNPNDNMSWMRVINFPARSIGIKTSEILSKISRENNISLFDSASLLVGRSSLQVSKFLDLINDLTQESRVLNLSDLVEYVLKKSGLRSYYERTKDGIERLENLDELVTSARIFSEDEGLSNLPASLIPGNSNTDIKDSDSLRTSVLVSFLSHTSLESGNNKANLDDDMHDSISEPNIIQLMTVHSSKGLEFDIVFITGMEEGLFPHRNSMDHPSALEEERRLMYVAITRAKEQLYISLARTRMLHGKTRYSLPSRFLSEIPRNHIKWMKKI